MIDHVYYAKKRKEGRSMAVNPSFIKPLKAEIIQVKGTCNAGHCTGDALSISCYDTGGLCGFFYHDLFPRLSVMQFGGRFPWSPAGEFTAECPDRRNAVTIKLTTA
jgi:uncharacterized repeat protein (TIGR04076 family)